VAAQVPAAFLAEAKRLDPQGFAALRMGKPTPDEGSYFRAEDIVEYDAAELPKNLRRNTAPPITPSRPSKAATTRCSAASASTRRTTFGCCLTSCGSGWRPIRPSRPCSTAIQDAQAVAVVDGKRADFKVVRTVPAKAHAGRKDLRGARPVTVSKDKPTRARSIQGRMRMRKVRFPRVRAVVAQATRAAFALPARNERRLR
jgi:hypothetical protein